MYLRYAERSDWSEEELKRQIAWALTEIAEIAPKHLDGWPESPLPPETPTSIFVARVVELPFLSNIRPIVSKAELRSEPKQALRIIFRDVSLIRWKCEIEIRMLGVVGLMTTSIFLGVRFVVAADMIEKVLEEKLQYDYNAICDHLLNPYGHDPNEADTVFGIAAEEEIERVLTNEATRERFLDIVNRFDDRVEAQIEAALPDVIREFAFRLTTEAVISAAGIIEEAIGEESELDVKAFRGILDGIVRKGMRFTSERLGITRGGRRSTDKFVWNDDRKMEFFKTVMSLVHTNGKPLWKLAHEELVEKDFAYLIIQWLRSETDLKSAPTELWNNAIKVWKGHASDFSHLSPEKKPEAFAMYHAMDKLGFPQTAFSTLKKYFGEGRKLSGASTDT